MQLYALVEGGDPEAIPGHAMADVPIIVYALPGRRALRTGVLFSAGTLVAVYLGVRALIDGPGAISSSFFWGSVLIGFGFCALVFAVGTARVAYHSFSLCRCQKPYFRSSLVFVLLPGVTPSPLDPTFLDGYDRRRIGAASVTCFGLELSLPHCRYRATEAVRSFHYRPVELQRETLRKQLAESRAELSPN
ncbi:MAG TPA: hypothetical protein VEH52_02945 [Gaiellaceae bacterium]|nr:hypothetical protein [Gaiellaceae bacterium]